MPRIPQLRRRHRTFDLAAGSLTNAPPILGNPSLGQIHRLAGAGLAVQPPVGRTATEIAFANRLIEIISASPDTRTKSKEALVDLGMREFRLSKKRARELRERVIEQLGTLAWSKPGAPTKPYGRPKPKL